MENTNQTTINDEFLAFPKMARLSREVIISEKIDGTNACVYITDEGKLLIGSRTRWITPQDDNAGFARWVTEHRDELITLGPGRHFGEWWGLGIQRKYNMKEKRWSLFNVSRWCAHGTEPALVGSKLQEVLPACCHLAPVLYRGPFTTEACDDTLAKLKENGSAAAPGFMNPEGIVCYHIAANMCFKKTIEGDGLPKSLQLS